MIALGPIFQAVGAVVDLIIEAVENFSDILKLTAFQLLDKLVKQRYKLALNLRVNFLCGCIIIKVRGLVASIQQCNPRLFIVDQAI